MVRAHNNPQGHGALIETDTNVASEAGAQLAPSHPSEGPLGRERCVAQTNLQQETPVGPSSEQTGARVSWRQPQCWRDSQVGYSVCADNRCWTRSLRQHSARDALSSRPLSRPPHYPAAVIVLESRKGTGLGSGGRLWSQTTWWGVWPCRSSAVWPRTNPRASVCLSSLTCKVWVMTASTSGGRCEFSGWAQVRLLEQWLVHKKHELLLLSSRALQDLSPSMSLFTSSY